jgi:hypothetical protein
MSEFQTPEGEVLGKAKHTVELRGRKYDWDEPSRRTLRRMMIELTRIMEGKKIQGRVDDSEVLQSDSLAFIDEAFDFMLKWHPGMATDRAFLEDTPEVDIATAIGGLTVFLSLPFVQDRAKTAAS